MPQKMLCGYTVHFIYSAYMAILTDPVDELN